MITTTLLYVDTSFETALWLADDQSVGIWLGKDTI